MAEYEQYEDDIIDLGSIAGETRGLGVIFADTDGGQQNAMGLSDD